MPQDIDIFDKEYKLKNKISMKKVFFLLALVPLFLFSCSDDDDEEVYIIVNQYEQALFGSWTQDNSDAQEVSHIQFLDDLTGLAWTTVDGVAGPNSNFAWGADATTITTLIGEVATIGVYTLQDGILTITANGETITYALDGQ